MDTQIERENDSPSEIQPTKPTGILPNSKITPSLPKNRNKWLIPLILLGAASLGLGTWYAIGLLGSKPQPSAGDTKVLETKTEADATISALGRLEPQGEVIKVASPSALGTSRIIRLMVKEGDTVKQDDVIAVLDSYFKNQAALAQAQSQAQEAAEKLEQVRAGAKSGDIQAQQSNVLAAKANVERAKVEFDKAVIDYKRYEILYKEGAASAFTLDSFAIKVKSLGEQLNQAQQQFLQAQGLLSSTAEVRPVDIRVAEAALQSAIVKVKSAQVDLDLSQVRAPISGQVLKVHSKVGEVVGSDGVVELGNTQQMYAVAEVYETDINKIKIGQKATIASNSRAFEGEISGTVEQIGLRIAKNDVLGTDPAAKTDVRIIEVKIRLDDSKKVSGLTNSQISVKINTR
ncbi:efflux RND transporter periplasmic adaptor subunit [Tumidithrix elongata RA019]|uniref:Efflux RND transporter periplasmic adaptor subunit n=1 Tax=Tumidithrix elongata BACA0141 TaxID=2716417 RepID=A0AAW9PRP0_9CYAN|nr:efflux RND transporter periplasmic adaptor subunit [Tumidithrix elongata RA019]